MADTCGYSWGREYHERGAAMRVIPQRKIKSQIRQLFLMTGIFFLTLFACVGVFIVFTLSHVQLISPMTQLGRTFNEELSLVEVQTACNKTGLHCANAVELPDESIELTVGGTTTVFLSAQKNIEKQLASLQQVASQLTIKGKALKKVDFRFDQIIVSF